MNFILSSKTIGSIALLSALLTAPATSAAIVYSVTVDTSTVAAAAGNINFQLNPSGPAQGVSVDISSFSFVGGGSIDAPPSIIGNVTGALPGTVTITNGPGGLNDYFQQVTWGTSLTFLLSVYGPAVDTPDNTTPFGTTFGLALFNNNPMPSPILTVDPNGYAATIDISSLAPYITITTFATDSGPSAVNFQAVPEPATILTMGFSLGAIATVYRRRRKNR